MIAHDWSNTFEFDTPDGIVTVYRCCLCGAPSLDGKTSKWNSCLEYKVWVEAQKKVN